MRWFFIWLYGVSGILFVGFVAWIVTRMMMPGRPHMEQANSIVSRIIIYDLYVIGVLVAYVAFVGSWHLWEKLTGRMEPTETPPADERS